MESRKSGQYIRFWLDAESFQVSTWSRLRSQSLNSARKSSSTIKQDKHTSQPLRTGQWTSENTLDLGSSCQRVTEGSLPSSNTTSSEKLTEEVPNKPITDTGQPSVQPNQTETYLKPKPHSLPVTPVDPEDKHLPGAPDPTCDISDSIESRLSDTVSNSAIKRAESLKKTNLSQDELANKLRKSTVLTSHYFLCLSYLIFALQVVTSEWIAVSEKMLNNVKISLILTFSWLQRICLFKNECFLVVLPISVFFLQV